MHRPLPYIVAVAMASSGALSRDVAEETTVTPDARISLSPPAACIMDFLPARSVTRVGRPLGLSARIVNAGRTEVNFGVRLILPGSLSASRGALEQHLTLAPTQEREVSWEVLASRALLATLRIEVTSAGTTVADAAVPVRFLPALDTPVATYIPTPQPAPTRLLIGAHHCPLWEAGTPEMWTQVRKHMERVPALGFYAQDNPEVADWETAWAVEHGISFFIYCWYRTSQGGPVQTRFSSAIHDGLFRSRYAGQMKFTIMWENQNRGLAGVANEADLLENLMPFWVENYFRHPSYLKVDNRPLLFIYRPEFLVDDLGSVENVAAAFARMRDVCRAAGFDGLYLLGEYRSLDPEHLRLMRRLGLDYTFAYCWHVPKHNPTPQEAIAAQMNFIRSTQALGILPQVVTVSQGWSGWHDEGSIWTLPPADFEYLLRQAGEFVDTLPAGELGSRMLLLDNWNEWGEGHYIAPYTEHGFGYLDAVRNVFSSAAPAHPDLIPADVGLGPYDNAYRETVAAQARLRQALAQYVTRPGAEQPGLVGWWTFDEDDDASAALDYSGHGLGAALHQATRSAGQVGRALLCQGGCAVVPNHPALSLTQALTVTCRVKTERAGQDNTWIVNRVLAGGTDSGYRLGLLQGKPSFEVPQTPWSHHLTAAVDLPCGRWVHLAGTFDGATMRLYVDGVERGTLSRPGPLKPNAFPLCLGSYEPGHTAHFVGLLDEVKLYDRALSPQQIQREVQAK
jgi:hypothetical protein